MMGMSMLGQPMHSYNPTMMPLMGQNIGLQPLSDLKQEKSGKKYSRNELKQYEKKIRVLESEKHQLQKDNELLEDKCEEYLSQLQRSADIIKSTKDKQRIQIEAYEDKILELQDTLDSKKNINRNMENEVEKLLRLNEELNIRELAEHGELGNMIQDLRMKNGILEKSLEERLLDFQDLKEDLRLIQNQRDNLLRENEDLIQQIQDRKTKTEIEDDKYFNLETDYKNLKEDYQILRGDNIKFEAQNSSLYDRLGDKDKELDRMRAELEMLQRMISSLSQKNSREIPSPQQYYARDTIDRSNQFRHQKEYKDSPGTKNQKLRFQQDEDLLNSPVKINSNKSYRFDSHKETRHQNDNLHDQTNNRRNYDQRQYPENDANKEYNRIDNRKSIDEMEISKATNHGRVSDQSGNILTWDQPYEKKRDNHEIKYEEKEARRRKLNDSHNYKDGAFQARSPIVEDKQGFRNSRSINKQDTTSNNNLVTSNKTGTQNKPSMHKLDHEMTQNEKSKIKLEKSLLSMQVQRDNIYSQLEKLKRTEKKTGQVLRKIKDLEHDEDKIEKEISKIKIDIKTL